MLRYYVINLPSMPDRRERIARRLQYYRLYNQTTFIEAIDKSSPLLDWFEASNTFPRRSNRGEHACFLSHLKALRTFVNDTEVNEAIILEDDAMLINNFPAKLEGVLFRKDPTTSLIMFCFIAASWDEVKQVQPNFYTITPNIYGAQAYWISKDYAKWCLSQLDKPLNQLPEKFVTSELITRLSGGYFISPPLVIEEAIHSTLRLGNTLNIQRSYFSNFNYENYSATEPEDVRIFWDKEESSTTNN